MDRVKKLVNEKKVVYFDKNYKGSWISKEESKIIKNFLVKKHFSVKNAEELKSWMNVVINNNINETVVVFSIDIIPFTIYETNETKATIFKYLRKKGKIIWIGDVPFYYKGHPNDPKNTGPRLRGVKDILNVETSGDFTVRDTRITSEGKQIGLKRYLMGSRPVKISYGLVPLTVSKNSENIDEANMWIKRRFVRLFDINKTYDIEFDITNHLEEIYNIALYPIDNLTEIAQGKKDVFIVHGHDENSVDEIKEIITDLGLRPRFLKHFGSGSETLVDLLEKTRICAYVIILITPDDFVIEGNNFDEFKKSISNISIKNIKDLEKYIKPCARPNVVFEFGFFRGVFGPNRICVLLKSLQDRKCQLPSDINGVYYLEYKESLFERKLEIINRLKNINLI